ncbi:Natterin-3 like [Actinidia chinensis var. chinensis]|uniref:Natterin-3 like n=1 Tax=Actinidia chinensis var. chinensis TaxID=1590841 RepID=A0A2R6R6R8_ACTCC|nr:Natterin-3 like [Actinidia chinensis var. chinensis]
MALPRFVVLKSNYNDKYLRYINEDVQVHGFLQFSGEEVVSPYVKYEVEMAKNGKGLVHIRCCYNNKYWVRWSSSHWWIVAGADEPEEDQSKWSCTLFEPVYADDAKTIVRFRHVQLGHNACLWRAAPPHESCLFAGSAQPDKDRCDIYTIIDWESLLILPKHIAFKGDNGNYLSARWIEGYRYLQFGSSDIGDPTVGNEVFTTHDGSVRIKSDHFGKFWRRSPNWIWADSDDTTSNNSDTLFWPIKVDNNIVALRNLGNNNFCKRLTTEGKTSCLNAAVSSISREARLEVCELVISRNIYNVNFRLMDARIYNQNVLTMATGNAINRSQEPNTIDMKLSYTDTRSSTWNTNVSLKLGVKTSFQTGIPLIAEGKVEISAEFSGAYQWGETQSSTTVMETVYKVTVPPMTMVKVSLLATKGSCDVPFSYSQRDTLINGQQTTHHMDDGVYTGMNCFNFKYETKQEKL